MNTVIADPASAHWYAWHGELACLPMGRNDNPDELPAHPGTVTEDEAFRAGWYSVDFYAAFDERNPDDAALVKRLREIETRLRNDHDNQEVTHDSSHS